MKQVCGRVHERYIEYERRKEAKSEADKETNVDVKNINEKIGLKNFEKSKPGTWKTENGSRKR